MPEVYTMAYKTQTWNISPPINSITSKFNDKYIKVRGDRDGIFDVAHLSIIIMRVIYIAPKNVKQTHRRM